MSYPKLTPITAKGATEPRYLEDRFADSLNVKDYGAKGDGTTDDTSAIQSAINDAIEHNRSLLFPNGVYKVTSNISKFLQVYKLGDGIVKHGDYNFTVCPKFEEENIIYAAPIDTTITASSNNAAFTAFTAELEEAADNDGITPDTATTIHGAVNGLKHIATNKGTWIIHLCAGEFKEPGVTLDDVPSFIKPVTFIGEITVSRVSINAEYNEQRLYFYDENCTSVYMPDETLGRNSTWSDALQQGLYTISYQTKWSWLTASHSGSYAFYRDRTTGGYGNFRFQDIWFTDWMVAVNSRNSGAIMLDSCNSIQYRNRYYHCGVGEWLRSGWSRTYYCQFVLCNTGGTYQYSHSGTVGAISSEIINDETVPKYFSCLFYGCTVYGMQPTRASVMHCDGNIFINNYININTVYVSRCALLNSLFISWTYTCLYIQNFSVVANAESCVFKQAVNGNIPVSLIDQQGNLDCLPVSNPFLLNTYCFPNSTVATVNGDATTNPIPFVVTGPDDENTEIEPVFVNNRYYPRLATLIKRDFENLGNVYSHLMLSIHIKFTTSGTGGDTFNICLGNSEGIIENSSLGSVTLPTGGGNAGWLHFYFQQIAPPVLASGVSVPANGLVGSAAFKWVLEPSSSTVSVLATGSVSSTYLAYRFASKSMDLIIPRLYVTLGARTNTVTIAGWYTEVNRG